MNDEGLQNLEDWEQVHANLHGMLEALLTVQQHRAQASEAADFAAERTGASRLTGVDGAREEVVAEEWAIAAEMMRLRLYYNALDAWRGRLAEARKVPDGPGS